MFINPAFAEDAAQSLTDAGAGSSSIWSSMLPILLIFFVFYFMVIRPQNKRFQDHRSMINNLQKGDTVVTGGGLVATVVKLIGEDEVLLKLADGVEVTAVRATIMTVRKA